jgi:hypothetical protein
VYASFFCVATMVCGQTLPQSQRLWSIGPITIPDSGPAPIGITFGPGGARITGPEANPQTRSIFSATRSVVFAGDRIVLAVMGGMRRIEGAQNPASVYRVFSLDAKTGLVKDSKEYLAFGSLALFATDDAHVIVAARKLERLTPDLKTEGTFEYAKFGRVQDVSPDGTTLGEETSPGFSLIDSHTLEAKVLTPAPAVSTSSSTKSFVTDNIHWIRDYPKDKSFITLIDASGEHLIFHGDCGGRPRFLRDDRVLTATCKIARILNTQGDVLKTITAKEPVSFAGVSKDGRRFALQLASFEGEAHSVKKERFVIYSVETGEPVTELLPDVLPEEQSWAAFSPDGTMFVAGSPLKLTLYRLP